jgi:hypothetical protein
MVLVFQYGSNCLESEINSRKRLKGKAMFVDIAKTIENYKLDFDVYSENRGCAAADIVRTCQDKRVWGVLYRVDDNLISRKTAPKGSKSFDAIEGEGKNYRRHCLPVRRDRNGPIVMALTYVAIKPSKRVKKTSLEYVQLIIKGLREHNVAERYINEIKEIISNHSPRLAKKVANL